MIQYQSGMVPYLQYFLVESISAFCPHKQDRVLSPLVYISKVTRDLTELALLVLAASEGLRRKRGRGGKSSTTGSKPGM